MMVAIFDHNGRDITKGIATLEDREQVRTILIDAITSVLKDNRDYVAQNRRWCNDAMDEIGPIILGVDGELDTDVLVDRVIEGLTQ